MLGGYQILDLRNIDLSRGTSEASITDAEVLKQISNLRDHIQKTYDFSKPLQNQLKPLLIRYRDKKVGEKHEVALYGNIEVINVYYKFRIIACNESEKLTINVEFEEKTDEYDNKYWDIKTAKVLLTNEQPIFEEITDKDGHKRFIEGSVTPINAIKDYVPYAKWSLSGSHLMLVLCIFNTSESDITVSGASVLGNVTDLPQWVKDKIIPMGNSPHVMHNFSVEGVKPDDLTQDSSLQATYVLKDNNTIALNGVNFTAKSGFYYRIEFDLLIDNESQD